MIIGKIFQEKITDTEWIFISKFLNNYFISLQILSLTHRAS